MTKEFNFNWTTKMANRSVNAYLNLNINGQVTDRVSFGLFFHFLIVLDSFEFYLNSIQLRPGK